MSTLFERFSPRQMLALTWWCAPSAYAHKDGVICDGAVRSGKTLCMSVSFVAWAFSAFDDASFALCGKTVSSLTRNLLTPLLQVLGDLGFACRHTVSHKRVDITYAGRRNRLYLFGGRDEASASLIQGVTLAGVLFDEVALMPRSFVEQALARCSTQGAKFWFNCNPEHPLHWFHQEWIQKAAQKNCLYIHFTMRDNPSLSEAVIHRYESLYSGAFYERFILGKWTAPQGLVYPMFTAADHVREPEGTPTQYRMSCDYGTVNPCSVGLWGLFGKCWFRVDEYYYDSRARGRQRTDEEHYRALETLAGDKDIAMVIVDPSAASFIECIRRHGRFAAVPARNEVVDGIRRFSDALKNGELAVSARCRDTIREFGLYRWDERSAKDTPRKEHDHAMDDVRYFVSAGLRNADNGFFALGVRRG